MQYRILHLLCIGLIMGGCQGNEDITSVENFGPFPVEVATTVMTLQGWVHEAYSPFSNSLNLLRLSNVTVALKYEDQTLDQTNTNSEGYFVFSEQDVPADGAFLEFTSSGYYPGISKIDTLPFDYYSNYILPQSSLLVNGQAIADREEYIILRGSLQEPTPGSGFTFFITNAANELLGTYTSDGDLGFKITTIPNEELFLYYQSHCGLTGPIALGVFNEDTDLGALFDGTYDFYEELVFGDVTVTECSGGSVNQDYLLLTVDGLTSFWDNGLSYYEQACLLANDPNAFITVVDPVAREFGEVSLNYTSGLQWDVAVEVCSEDATFLQVGLNGGPEIGLDLYTFSNVLPSGRAIVKQINPSGPNMGAIVFELQSALPGTTTGRLIITDGHKMLRYSDNTEFTIIANDGIYLEGSFNTNFFDEFEIPLGVITGTFKARIH